MGVKAALPRKLFAKAAGLSYQPGGKLLAVGIDRAPAIKPRDRYQDGSEFKSALVKAMQR